MKCLCCRQTFFYQSSLKNHYLAQHNVDENNHFFKKLVSRDRAFVPRKCLRCNYLCLNSRNEKSHKFLSHYQQGGRQPIEVLYFVFIIRADPRQVCFKCTLTIVNSQPAPRAGFAEITNSRVWQTNVYDGVYFNNFIKSNLAQDILKRVIMNDITGGSWRFKRFDRISCCQ